METTAPDYPRGVTFEEVWATLKENAEQLRLFKVEMEESSRKWNERFEKDRQEWQKNFGDLSNRFGELAEHLVAPNIHERFNEMGYHFSEAAEGGTKIIEAGKIIAQIDLLLQNVDTVMAVEVKSKPKEKDIDEHIERLEKFRDHRHKFFNDNRDIEGAIAGAIFNENVKKASIEAGLYVIEQTRDTMKINVPDGFVPRKF